MNPAAVDKLEDIRRSLAILESVVSDPEMIRDLSEDERIRLMKAAGKLARPTRLQRSRISRLECRSKPLRDGDTALLARFDDRNRLRPQ